MEICPPEAATCELEGRRRGPALGIERGPERRHEGTPGNAELLTVQWTVSPRRSVAGDPVFLADGALRLKVVSVEGATSPARSRPAAPSAPSGRELPGADADLPETGASTSPGIDFACENGIDCGRLLRPPALRPREGRARLREREADIPLIARSRSRRRPNARGDHRGRGQRDHGRRAATSAWNCRTRRSGGRQKRLIRTRRAGLQAGDHGDPDARDDGAGLAADQGRVTDVANAILRRHRRVMLSEGPQSGTIRSRRSVRTGSRGSPNAFEIRGVGLQRVEEHEHDVGGDRRPGRGGRLLPPRLRRSSAQPPPAHRAPDQRTPPARPGLASPAAGDRSAG